MEDWQRFHIQIIRISEEKNDRTKLIFKTIIQENFSEIKDPILYIKEPTRQQGKLTYYDKTHLSKTIRL